MKNIIMVIIIFIYFFAVKKHSSGIVMEMKQNASI